MNFYDILAAEKWDGGISTMNFFDLLFAQSISGEQWQVYEGTLPATINANGSDMRQYQIWGNVGGVGDKTVNLFDKNSAYEAGYYTSKGTFAYSDGVITYDYFPVEALTEYFYKAFNATPSSAESERAIRVNFFNSQKSFISRFLDIGTALSIKNVTTPQNCAFVRLSVNKILSNIVFGTVPFETFVPFGYELDIGVKSANLLDYSTVQNNLTVDAVTGLPTGYNGRIANLTPIDVSTVSAVTITYNINHSGIIYFMYSILTADDTMLIRKISKNNGDAIEIPAGGVKLYISWYGAFSVTTDDITQVMVSVNPSDKYQPYSNTTTPIYIGDEPLEKVGDYTDYADYEKQKVVRKIKKYVLDGTENWEQVLGADGDSTKNYFRFTLSSATYLNANFSRCSHFTWQWINTSTTVVGFGTHIPTGSNAILFVVRPENVADMVLSDFKLWLAEQYAAGTPVTVWCALTTAEEIDPPVPLPALPTCEGTTVLDYAGQSVAPEKVLLEYVKGGN